jgi:hypothetical protein
VTPEINGNNPERAGEGSHHGVPGAGLLAEGVRQHHRRGSSGASDMTPQLDAA